MKQAQQCVSKLFVDSEKRFKVIMNKCYGWLILSLYVILPEQIYLRFVTELFLWNASFATVFWVVTLREVVFV